jgi:hypothetical protein
MIAASRELWTRVSGLSSWDRTTTGHRDRTAGTGQPELPGRTAGKEQLRQDNQDKAAGTGQPGEESQDRRTGTGKSERQTG